MATLLIENMPESLFERIERLAHSRHQEPADTVVDVLQATLSRSIPAIVEGRLPQEPFLSEEIVAPCSIPRPVGERVIPIEVVDYIPKPHDVPDAD